VSWDINIIDPLTGETRVLREKHALRGAVYALGGTRLAELTITANYSPYYRKIWGQELGELDGKPLREVKPLFREAVIALGTLRAPSYWTPTSGNAGSAMQTLLNLCELCYPNDIFHVE